jgi:hypothetical protein
MEIVSRFGAVVVTLLIVIAVSPASAQIEPYNPPVTGSEDGDWSQRITEILPEGVETRSEVRARMIAYEPDPETFPVPRSSWNGKPDFSGVYWPSVEVLPPPVPLESLYRPDVLEYREGGGAAVGVIDWRGIDTPRFHCWPRSPTIGSASGTVQLVSAPGYLLMLTDGQGNFRVIPIADEVETVPAESHEPSYQGSSIAYWEGDTLVVDVTNFNGKPWLSNALPPADAQIVEYSVVIEDPKMLTAPWTGPVIRMEVLSYDTLQESICLADPELDARHLEFATQTSEEASSDEAAAQGSAQ